MSVTSITPTTDLQPAKRTGTRVLLRAGQQVSKCVTRQGAQTARAASPCALYSCPHAHRIAAYPRAL